VLAVSEPDMVVRQVSRNLANVVGTAWDDALGRPLAEVLGTPCPAGRRRCSTPTAWWSAGTSCSTSASSGRTRSSARCGTHRLPGGRPAARPAVPERAEDDVALVLVRLHHQECTA
jgi:hypothetical protein